MWLDGTEARLVPLRAWSGYKYSSWRVGRTMEDGRVRVHVEGKKRSKEREKGENGKSQV